MNQPNIQVVNAHEAPAVYRSRSYWEDLFRTRGIWPRFLAHDATAMEYSHQIDMRFPRFQLVALLDNAPVGLANSIPLHIPANSPLPETGWDWALAHAFSPASLSQASNTLCGLSITVLPEHQSLGIGTCLIQSLLSSAQKHGFQRVIIPGRPIRKSDHPLTDIAEYLTWRRPDGTHFDPWIRTHERQGAILVGPCRRSMVVEGTLAQWEDWTGLKLQTSGDVIIPGGLALLKVDTQRNHAIYQEPNVWMSYNKFNPSLLTKETL